VSHRGISQPASENRSIRIQFVVTEVGKRLLQDAGHGERVPRPTASLFERDATPRP
jgi:hypothetical protein